MTVDECLKAIDSEKRFQREIANIQRCENEIERLKNEIEVSQALLKSWIGSDD